MKKSNYILITTLVLLLGMIAYYFIDININKEKNRTHVFTEKAYRDQETEMGFALNQHKKNPTDIQSWETFVNVLKNIPIDHKNINSRNLKERASYVLENYKNFNDTIAIKIIAKQCKNYYNTQNNHQYDINRVYAKILYELNDIKKAKEVEQDLHNKQLAEIPTPIMQWIDGELAKNTIKPIQDLHSSNFFNHSKAKIIGYIKGYNGNQSFDTNTGMIYMDDILNSEYFPVIVNIDNEGKFEADIPLKHPIHSMIIINNKLIPFYIEPNQTLAIILDVSDLRVKRRIVKNHFFKGELSQVNHEVNNSPKREFNYDLFMKDVKNLNPKEYQEKRTLEFKNDLNNVENYANSRTIGGKSISILNNKVMVSYGVNMLDYLENHPTDILLEPLNKTYKPNAPDSYYAFLNNIPLNDQTLLVENQFSTFINRFEYMDRLKTETHLSYSDDNTYLSIQHKRWKTRDAMAKELGIDIHSFIYNIAKTRSLKHTTESIQHKAYEYWEAIKTTENPYLLKTANQIISTTINSSKNGYELPKTKAGDIFKKLIKPYSGKILFVKFWDIRTGAHALKKELTKSVKSTQEKYKDELVFMYITEQHKSLEDKYTVFINQHHLTNTISITADEMNQLRQLFKKSNFNFWIAISKNGTILNDDFPMHNVNTEIQKIINP